MKRGKQLYHLIHSLSPAEKRMFRSHAGQKCGRQPNVYLQLFNTMEAMKPYNEEALKNQFPEISQLSVYKNYLLKTLLEVLEQYDQEHPEAQGRHLLNQLQALIRRRQFHLAARIYRKALQHARKYHLTLQLVQLQALYPDLYPATAPLENTAELTQPLSCPKEAEEMLLLLKITQLTVQAIHTSPAERPPLESEVQALMEQPPRHLPQQLMLYYLGHQLHVHPLHSTHTSIQQAHTLLDEHPELRLNFPRMALAVDVSWFHSLLASQQFAEAGQLLQEMEKGQQQEDHRYLHPLQEEVSSTLVNCWLRWHEAQYSTDGYHYWHERKGALPAAPAALPHLAAASYFSILRTCFWNQRYSECVQYSFALINMKERPYRSQWVAAHLYALLSHYEMGNLKLLRQLLDSFEKNLSKENEQYGLSSAFTLFRRLSDQRTTGRHGSVLSESQEHFRKLREENSPLLRYLELDAWLESRITQRPFVQVLQERARSQQPEQVPA